MKRFSLLLIILIYITADLRAQGFNSFNNRNHPYLNWEVAEPEHFKIIYPDRISGLVLEEAAIAEESYRDLSQTLDTAFVKWMRTYMTEEDELLIGSPNPARQSYSIICVKLNEYVEACAEEDKSVRKLIAHQQTHILHLKPFWFHFALLN